MPQYFFPPGNKYNEAAVAVELGALVYVGDKWIKGNKLGSNSSVLVPLLLGGGYYWYWKWVRDPKRVMESKMIGMEQDVSKPVFDGLPAPVIMGLSGSLGINDLQAESMRRDNLMIKGVEENKDRGFFSTTSPFLTSARPTFSSSPPRMYSQDYLVQGTIIPSDLRTLVNSDVTMVPPSFDFFSNVSNPVPSLNYFRADYAR